MEARTYMEVCSVEAILLRSLASLNAVAEMCKKKKKKNKVNLYFPAAWKRF